MKITKKILLITLLLLIVGCGDKEKENTQLTNYVWKAKPTELIDYANSEEVENCEIIFQSDNTFLINVDNESYNGTYEIKKNKVIIKGKKKGECTIKENSLTCNVFAKKFTKYEPEE